MIVNNLLGWDILLVSLKADTGGTLQETDDKILQKLIRPKNDC